MRAYILRRLLFMIPTLLGIMVINFFVIQAAPGGPVEQAISQLQGRGDVTSRFTSGGETAAPAPQATPGGEQSNNMSRGGRGLPPELIERIRKQYGFDKPIGERFFQMMRGYLVFDLGESFFRNARVADLVISKMPVSISLGLWTTLLVYLISIPLGIAKAVRDGSRFDVASSSVVIIGNAIPGFLFALLLVVLFAGGSFWKIFPLRGIVSDDWRSLSWGALIVDYAWHMVLPITAMVIGGFATLTMLTKNSFLEEIGKQYVLTARAKGLVEWRVLYGHVFRNAMLIVIAGFPAAFIGVLFSGSLLIEVIFSLDGMGLLGFEAALGRDYPVMFGTLWTSGPARPAGRADRRSDVHAGRSADRFRGAGRLMRLSPITRRRFQRFFANRRGTWSLVIFAALFFVSLFAELIANDRPILVRYDGAFYFPIFKSYPETTFGGEFTTQADYKDPEVAKLIDAKGWMLWPVIPYSYDTIVKDLGQPAPSPPSWRASARHRRPGARRAGPPGLQLPHLGAVRLPADHPGLDCSASSPAPCRAISAA